MDNAIVLMIVDDERNIRQEIISQHDWSSEGITEVLEASDGIEALEISKIKQPDIIITDINMPRMNGLELVKNVYETNKKTKFVMFSESAKFEYVKTAMEYGIVDYIVKSSSIKEIIKVIQKCVALITKDREQTNHENYLVSKINQSIPVLRERFFNKIMLTPYVNYNKLLQEYEFLNINLKNKNLCVIVAQLDLESIPKYWENENERYILNFAIVNVLNEIAEEINGIAFENIIGNFVIIISNVTSKDAIDLFAQKCIKTISKSLDIHINLGIGSFATDFSKVSNSYNGAVLALECGCALGINYLHVDNIISKRNAIPGFPNNFEEKMFSKIISGNIEGIKNEMDNYLLYVTNNGFLTLEYLKGAFSYMFSYFEFRMIELQMDPAENQYDKNAMVENIRKCRTVKVLIDKIIKLLCNVADKFSKLRQDKNCMLMMKAKKYIDDNLDNPGLSLEIVASSVNLSSNYFANIFKKSLGESPSDYIIKRRIERAKALLKMPGIKVYQVSKMVGYKDQRYFSQIFKKYCGMLPTEFSKRANLKTDV